MYNFLSYFLAILEESTTEDIDKCAENLHECPENSECISHINELGTYTGYTCQCNDGFFDYEIYDWNDGYTYKSCLDTEPEDPFGKLK